MNWLCAVLYLFLYPFKTICPYFVEISKLIMQHKNLTIFLKSDIQREEEKTKRMLKDAAKKGDKDTCRILAKEIVHARKAISRIYASKAHLNSVQLSMKQQLGESVLT